MNSSNAIHHYMIGFFDVLGFKNRFQNLGLSEIAKRYDALIDLVNARSAHMATLFGGMNFHEGAYLVQGPDAFIFHRMHGAYASDSILIWAHANFPEARGISEHERKKLAADPAQGWMYHPIPYDVFLEECNELMCHSLEVDLPLRDAFAMGEAILDGDRRVFLGQPLIDANGLEQTQKIIGASFTKSFASQTIPKRFGLPFDSHLKDKNNTLFAGQILDWPRHWRNTRSNDLRKIVGEYKTNTPVEFSAYYQNTLDLIDASDAVAGQFETPDDLSPRKMYKQFASDDVQVHVRPFRVVPIEP